jgi:signal transduction histidine kinase
VIGRLRLRLILASASVLLLALAAAVLLLHHRASREMSLLVMGEMHERHMRVQRELQEYWRSHHSWAGVEPALASMERFTGFRIGVTVGGQLVGVSSAAPSVLAAWRRGDRGSYAMPMELAIRGDSGAAVGKVAFLDRLSDVGSSERAAASLHRWTMVVLISVAAAGLILTLLVARAIAGPLEQLTATVRAVGAGDRSRRARLDRRDEIGVLGAAFDDALDRLEHQEKLRQDLVSDVAHELRSPLHNLRGELEAAADGLRATDGALVHSLQEEVQHLSSLVADLEELALADAGRLRVTPVEVDVAQLVDRAMGLCSIQADARRVRLDRELQPGLTLTADPERLVQVLRNLLENAIRHSREVGQVDVAASAGDGVVELRISDCGAGIAAADLPRVFDRFFRADDSRARATGGAGLGLAIVKQIVELHGGSVGVESEPGVRTTFTVTLPSRRAS